MAENIKHQGIVENIDGTHMQVRIVQTSACASCSIKGHCTSADTKEKLIDVTDIHADAYRPGDRVWVVGTLSMGMHAVMLAFGVPLVLMIVLLFVLMDAWDNELMAVGGTMFVMANYYFILWLNRAKLKKQFAFHVQPVGEVISEA